MKKIKVLMLVVFFVVALISTSGLFAGEKVAKCAACGKVIKKGDAVKGTYDGKSYLFENNKCKDAFLKDPKKHLASYTCPMASCKTFSDKSGKCPKCGMELKKIEKKDCDGKKGHDHKKHEGMKKANKKCC